MSDEFSEDVTQTTESSLPIKEIPRDVALKICSGQVRMCAPIFLVFISIQHF